MYTNAFRLFCLCQCAVSVRAQAKQMAMNGNYQGAYNMGQQHKGIVLSISSIIDNLEG